MTQSWETMTSVSVGQTKCKVETGWSKRKKGINKKKKDHPVIEFVKNFCVNVRFIKKFITKS